MVVAAGSVVPTIDSGQEARLAIDPESSDIHIAHHDASGALWVSTRTGPAGRPRR